MRAAARQRSFQQSEFFQRPAHGVGALVKGAFSDPSAISPLLFSGFYLLLKNDTTLTPSTKPGATGLPGGALPIATMPT